MDFFYLRKNSFLLLLRKNFIQTFGKLFDKIFGRMFGGKIFGAVHGNLSRISIGLYISFCLLRIHLILRWNQITSMPITRVYKKRGKYINSMQSIVLARFFLLREKLSVLSSLLSVRKKGLTSGFGQYPDFKLII